MVKGPTRVTQTSKTIIDLIVTNRPERITRVYNLLTGLSDHNMILVARNLTKQRFQQFANKSKPGNQVIHKNVIVEVKNDLNNTDWNSVTQSSNLENCCNSMMKILTKITEKYTRISKQKPKKVSLPCLGNDIRQLMKKRIMHWKKHCSLKPILIILFLKDWEMQ